MSGVVTWAAWALGLISLPTMVRGQAEMYGLDPVVVACICQQESGWDPRAVSEDRKHLGLFQWSLPSFRETRKAMGDSDWEVDARFDAWVSTETAMYAMSHGHLGWWSTADKCKEAGDELQGGRSGEANGVWQESPTGDDTTR
jgi:hypothetical protein